MLDPAIFTTISLMLPLHQKKICYLFVVNKLHTTTLDYMADLGSLIGNILFQCKMTITTRSIKDHKITTIRRKGDLHTITRLMIIKTTRYSILPYKNHPSQAIITILITSNNQPIIL